MIEDVIELIKRENRTIPIRNQTMAFDRPMIFLGYSVVGIADDKNTNILTECINGGQKKIILFMC